MGDFANTAWGVVLGGGIVVVGQFAAKLIESSIEKRRQRREFKIESIVSLQDSIELLSLAVQDARDHLAETNWQPARYRRARMRVRALAPRIHDADLQAQVEAVLASAESASRGGTVEPLLTASDNATDRTSELLRNLHRERWWSGSPVDPSGSAQRGGMQNIDASPPRPTPT